MSMDVIWDTGGRCRGGGEGGGVSTETMVSGVDLLDSCFSSSSGLIRVQVMITYIGSEEHTSELQ